MLPGSPETPQYLILAIERHQQLLQEAERQRQVAAAAKLVSSRPRQWQKLRMHLGDLLIQIGRRVKADTVWG